jgi:hypothetical protein
MRSARRRDSGPIVKARQVDIPGARGGKYPTSVLSQPARLRGEDALKKRSPAMAGLGARGASLRPANCMTRICEGNVSQLPRRSWSLEVARLGFWPEYESIVGVIARVCHSDILQLEVFWPLEFLRGATGTGKPCTCRAGAFPLHT